MPRVPISQDIFLNTNIARQVTETLKPGEPDLPSIITFAEHPFFLGKVLYPKQRTILRLIYLETHTMTAYDLDTIDEWSTQWLGGPEKYGVPPDIWARIRWLRERRYRHFREIEFVGGRRGGKGHIGAIIAAYENYRMLKLKPSPQAFYGIDPSKDVYCFVTATTLQQAKQYQFADIVNAVDGSPAFSRYLSRATDYSVSLRTEADTRRIAAHIARGKSLEREIASIRNVAMSSNSRSGRGAATFVLIFDEMAHHVVGTDGPMTAEAIYQALTPSLDQFGKDGLIYIPTSPYSKAGRAYTVYEDAIATDPETGEPMYPDMLVIQLPAWGAYQDFDNRQALKKAGIKVVFEGAPQVYDERQQREERRDPATFKVEKRAQWAEVTDAYFMPEMVDRMFAPIAFDEQGRFLGSKGFLPPHLEEQVDEIRELEPQHFGLLTHSYRGHADPSKSQSNFAVVFGHTEPFIHVDGTEWQHVLIDRIRVFKPEDYPDHQIPYDEVQEELVQEIIKYPTMTVFSYDQYGSFATVALLKKALREHSPRPRIREKTFTPQSKSLMYERTKSALGLNWVHAFRDTYFDEGLSLLEHELKFLEYVNGKIKKQDIGRVRTDDCADALVVVVSELLADQLDRYLLRERLDQEVEAGLPGGYHERHRRDEITTTRGQVRSDARDRLGYFNQGRRFGR